MNILVAINEKYIKQLNILLNSIQYSNPSENFDIYILNNDLSKEKLKEVQKGLKEKRFNICDIKIKNEDVKKFINIEKKNPKETYFRILASKYLPENLDRVLYLDADTVVINNLKELYDMDFEDNFYIATTHITKLLHKLHKIRLNIDEEAPYINTGVLLINLQKMRDIQIENDIKKYLEEVKNKVTMQDRDIITVLYGNKIKLVDSFKYNLGDRELNFYNLRNYKNPIGLKWIYKNTVIIHYYGKNKPWEKDYKGKLGSFYYKIERKIRNSGKVLILSCGTGGGHNSAARAVQEELIKHELDADFIEYLDIIDSGIKDTVNKLYLKTTNKEGKTFKVVYRLGELYQKTNIKSPVYGLNHLNKDKLYNYIKENEYEYIVTTHLFAAQVLTAIKKEHHINFMAIATDYECIPFWKETNPDYFVIPSEKLRENFTKKGIKDAKILPLGIPVKNSFCEKYNKNECRKMLNLDIDKKYVLILTGSMGFGNIEEMVKKLSENLQNVNFIVSCGTNKKLKEKIRETDKIITLPYIENLDLYMKSSDIILTKPGGLTTTEIAVLGKPFIHTMPIPGCETYNANFFEKNNMSFKCNNVEEVVEKTKFLINDNKKQKELIKNQNKLINKNSAKEIAKLIKKQIETRNEKWNKKIAEY